MKQFVIIAYDKTDEGALGRRMIYRDSHTKRISEARKSGNILFGTALLDEKTGEMMGSCMVVSFPTIEDVHKWVNKDPYTTGGVWKDSYVVGAKVGDAFKDLIKQI